MNASTMPNIVASPPDAAATIERTDVHTPAAERRGNRSATFTKKRSQRAQYSPRCGSPAEHAPLMMRSTNNDGRFGEKGKASDEAPRRTSHSTIEPRYLRPHIYASGGHTEVPQGHDEKREAARHPQARRGAPEPSGHDDDEGRAHDGAKRVPAYRVDRCNASTPRRVTWRSYMPNRISESASVAPS